MAQSALSFSDHPDIHRVAVNEKQYTIVGTAHVSQASADLVTDVITTTQPDCVCIELDEQRFQALSEKDRWEGLDLREVIRKKQLSTLLVNLVLSAYQRRMGEQLGVMPGQEMVAAAQTAQAHDIPIALCDRNVRITLRRAWRAMSFGEKMKFLTSALVGVFEKPELTEEQLAEIKQKDVLNELMRELGEAMPVLKTVLLDERDTYLAEKIRQTDGGHIVAVVGAGHAQGIVAALEKNQPADLAPIEVIPPASKAVKVIGWGIPAVIIGALIFIGVFQGMQELQANLLFWVLANGIPAGIGALIALAHPVTILVSFFGAPLTSLTPVIGAGYVAAFVQTYFQPPLVREFQTVSKDFSVLKKWWQNRLLKVLLVFILTSLGSVLGTYLGAYEIISNAFTGAS